MEIILSLLKAITKLAIALTDLAAALLTFTLGNLTGPAAQRRLVHVREAVYLCRLP